MASALQTEANNLQLTVVVVVLLSLANSIKKPKFHYFILLRTSSMQSPLLTLLLSWCLTHSSSAPAQSDLLRQVRRRWEAGSEESSFHG